MANRDIFSKHLPNVKLATRYDAEGQEVQVDVDVDVDAVAKENATFDMLVAAGYYRASIKGLSAFDKVVGGMTWCIECCDVDVDVDLLFHENLTIGQKIALVEKIVSVLPQMKCPYSIEPHQIQGLEFLAIHPVIEWLVKTSVENRNERGQRLKRFAVGQFHNHYQYKTDKEHIAKIRKASAHIKHIQELYAPVRLYERKEATSEDEHQRVRLTLLEYGEQCAAPQKPTGNKRAASEAEASITELEELKLEQLLSNLSLAKENLKVTPTKKLNADELQALHKHYAEFKVEMETDAKQLTMQNQVKRLEANSIALEHKLKRYEREQTDLKAVEQQEEEETAQARQELQQRAAELDMYKQTEAAAEPAMLARVLDLLRKHDELKKRETEFKEECRQDLANLQQEIDDLVAFNAQDPEEQAAAIAKEKAQIQQLKLQLAKRNRGIVAIQRKLDAMPDRTELTQYQRRFHELYNEMSAKHLETKQYYTLYNTLNDKKRYLEKELSLLNSVCEAYNEGMQSPHGREDFIKQFESIVAGVKHAEGKVRQKYNEERHRRDVLNEELQSLLELQRQYASAVKQLTKECQRCEQLQQHLKSIRRK